ncbi:MAG: Mov34/MPN/PAD-1 family protein [Methylococcales bacterium]|nr:Mov34/MPN/PAD-1 family protein [Methylococcales bacterium]
MFLKKFKFLNEQVLEIIKEAEVSASIKVASEICGLLVDNGYFIELIKVKNKTKKGGGFSFYYNEIRLLQSALQIMNHEIIGTFHSHPLYIAKPSESDIHNSNDDSYMLIIDVLDKEIGFWYIKNSHATKINYEIISA